LLPKLGQVKVCPTYSKRYLFNMIRQKKVQSIIVKNFSRDKRSLRTLTQLLRSLKIQAYVTKKTIWHSNTNKIYLMQKVLKPDNGCLNKLIVNLSETSEKSWNQNLITELIHQGLLPSTRLLEIRLLILKLSCDSRFQRAFTACTCVFKVITLVW